MIRNAWLLLLFPGLLGLCSRPSAVHADGEKKDSAGVVVDLGGLQSRTPRDWKREEPRGAFRSHQFRLPKAEGDKSDAALVIFSFNAGVGGSNEENIKRKKSVFIPPKGKTIDEATKIDTIKIGGMASTYVDIHGTYKDKPFPMASDDMATLRPDYRMLYVIFENNNGRFYVQLVGPAKTVVYHKKGFDEWLKAFK